jgi:hypothetical protein
MKTKSLKDRRWPSSPFEGPGRSEEEVKRFLRMRAAYEKSAFVSEGHVQVRQLGPVAFAKTIPPGECAITVLTRYSSGKIYGATSGKRGHLFYYDPSPDADTVVDIGVVGKNVRITGLVADEKVYGSAEDNDGGGFLFVYSPCEVLMARMSMEGKGLREVFDTPVEDQMFHSIVDPCHSAGRIEHLKRVSAQEGVAGIVLDRKRRILHGLTSKRGSLFSYSLDSNKVKWVDRVGGAREALGKLTIDARGIVYGSGACGRLFRFDPDHERVEFTKWSAPSLKGREAYNKVEAWALDESTGLIYGGTIDGILFEFDPRNGGIVCLGKPIDQMRTRTLAVGNDGRVYGVGGEVGKCCHLFVYEPGTRQLRDLGVLLATLDRPWYGYEIECSVTGRDGEIYFGENDRLSSLFIYYPPVAAVHLNAVPTEDASSVRKQRFGE